MDENAYYQLWQRETTHWYPVVRRDVVRAVTRNALDESNLRVLEVGSGTGGNVALLQEFGELTCVEMSQTARDLMTSRLGDEIDLRAGVWPHDRGLEPQERFDLIAMLDVLEHVDEEVESLVAVREHLSNSGMLVLTVPAYQWMWSTHDTVLHHKRRYTRRSLTTALESAGFEVQRISHFNTILFPAAMASRFVFRLLRIQRSPGQGVPRASVSSLLRWVFRREVPWLRRHSLPFGLSIIALARPRQ